MYLQTSNIYLHLIFEKVPDALVNGGAGNRERIINLPKYIYEDLPKNDYFQFYPLRKRLDYLQN